MTIEIVETQAYHIDSLVLVEETGAVWRTFSRPWWDIASWFWWWLMPGEKRVILTKHSSGQRTRVRAIKIAAHHVRIGDLNKNMRHKPRAA